MKQCEQLEQVAPREPGSRGGRASPERAVSVHATKAEATERARTLAHAQLPSRLEIYKEDGTLQETFNYPQ